MWEMQELSTTPSLNQTGEQNSPNSVTDGDTGDHGKMHINEDPSMRMDCEGETSSATTQTTATATSSSTTTSVANNLSNHTVHPSAVAAAIHHQLTSAGMGMIKPATGVAAVTNLTPAQAALGIPTEAEATAPALALLEPQSALLHPALRGVKAVNIAGSFARKRPLLGVPRSGMNPTKRTVMTLLARVKNSQGIHAIRNPTTHSLPEALQMITTPFILPQTMDTTMVGPQKESLSQGV